MTACERPNLRASASSVRFVCVLYTKRHVGRRGKISESYIFSHNIDTDTTGTSSGSYYDFEHGKNTPVANEFTDSEKS